MPTHPPLDLSTVFFPVSYQEWRRRVAEELGGEEAVEERLVTETLEGIRLESLHTREHPGFEPLAVPPPAPGPWRLWLESEIGEPEAAVASLRQGTELGASGAWLTLDEAGRQGLDSDFEEASTLVGRGGVALSAAADLEPIVGHALSHGMALGLEGGAQSLPLAALVLAAAGARNRGDLSGCLGADPLGALASGEPVEPASQLEEMASLALWASRYAPELRAVRVATAPYHDAGADAVQEVAFAVATGVSYLRQLTSAGLELEEAARQILFVFEVGRDFYLQLAKLRAARALWAMVLAAIREEDGAGRETSMALHARTSWRTKGAYDRWSNLLRETVEGMAAVLGGAEGLTLRPFDQAAAGESELGRRLALTTQLVLREEAHFHRVADPAAGSWSVEALTRELAERAWKLLRELEAAGGMTVALASGGMVEKAVGEAALRRRRALAERRLAVVGASAWASLEDPPPERPGRKPDPALLEARRAQLRRVREMERSAAFDALEQVGRRRGRPDPELVEALVEAARAGATLSQLVESLGRPESSTPGPKLPSWRDAGPFEELRSAVDRHQASAARRPRLHILEIAPHSQAAATSAWTRRLLASVGVEGREVSGPLSVEKALEAAAAEPGGGVVLVPVRHPEGHVPNSVLLASYAESLRLAEHRLVAAAGRPIPGAPGAIDLWLSDGGDVLESLRTLLRRLGVDV